MKYEVRIYGDPVLREKTRPLEKVDEEIRTLARDMLETMHAYIGCGLAAPQIGKSMALCVIDVAPEMDTDDKGNRLNPEATMPMILVNPQIIKPSKKAEYYEEGCLSFPDIRASIPRPVEITVRYLDAQGHSKDLHLRDFVARVVQHEVDHLNGVLFIDRMSTPKRIALANRLRRMKRETEAAMGQA